MLYIYYLYLHILIIKWYEISYAHNVSEKENMMSKT